MAKRTVRVIRTWEVEVDAEFGESGWDVLGKVTEGQLDEAPPDAEDRVLMPDGDSPYAKRADIPEAAVEVEQGERSWR